MERSDALAMVATAVDRSYVLLFVLGLKIMGQKRLYHLYRSASSTLHHH